MLQRITYAIPKPNLPTKVYIPIKRILQNQLMDGFKQHEPTLQLLKAQVNDTSAERAFFEIKTSSKYRIPNGFVKASDTKEFHVRVYGKGNYYFSMHDLNHIYSSQNKVEEGEKCLRFEKVECAGSTDFEIGDIVSKGDPVMPVLGPKRKHEVLFCLWRGETSVNSKDVTVQELLKELTLVQVSRCYTTWDEQVSELFKELGEHEPILGYHLPRVIESRPSALKLPTRFEVKAKGMGELVEKEAPVDFYHSRIQAVKEREGLTGPKKVVRKRYEFS